MNITATPCLRITNYLLNEVLKSVEFTGTPEWLCNEGERWPGSAGRGSPSGGPKRAETTCQPVEARMRDVSLRRFLNAVTSVTGAPWGADYDGRYGVTRPRVYLDMPGRLCRVERSGDDAHGYARRLAELTGEPHLKVERYDPPRFITAPEPNRAPVAK